MPASTSRAHWEGTLRKGAGGMELGSGALKAPFSFGTRFEGKAGTNPEELIGAALAGCFSMALSAGLEKAGHTAERVETEARVELEPEGDGFAITEIRLSCTGYVPGIDEKAFKKLAEETKSGCPVGKALASVKITLDARLEHEKR